MPYIKLESSEKRWLPIWQLTGYFLVVFAVHSLYFAPSTGWNKLSLTISIIAFNSCSFFTSSKWLWVNLVLFGFWDPSLHGIADFVMIYSVTFAFPAQLTTYIWLLQSPSVEQAKASSLSLLWQMRKERTRKFSETSSHKQELANGEFAFCSSFSLQPDHTVSDTCFSEAMDYVDNWKKNIDVVMITIVGTSSIPDPYRYVGVWLVPWPSHFC
jgi:hypothetical protein